MHLIVVFGRRNRRGPKQIMIQISFEFHVQQPGMCMCHSLPTSKVWGQAPLIKYIQIKESIMYHWYKLRRHESLKSPSLHRKQTPPSNRVLNIPKRSEFTNLPIPREKLYHPARAVRYAERLDEKQRSNTGKSGDEC